MPTTKCKHHGCKAAFTKSSLTRAEQALRMHIGRTHEHNIRPPNTANGNGRALIVDPDKSRKRPRSNLTDDEVAALLACINSHRDDYATKTACFRAALQIVGLDKRISVSYSAVERYFDKADALKNGGTAAEPGKRKYTKRQAKPVAQEVRVNFCPNCGCNIHAVATGMAMAQLH